MKKSSKKAVSQSEQENAVVLPTRESIESNKRVEELNKLHVYSRTVLPTEQLLLSVDGIPICVKGDIVALKAKAKAGKTTTLKYMASAMMKGDMPPLNCEVENCKVLWFDTEENLPDVKKIVEDVGQITGLSWDYIDSHLRVYSVRKLTHKTLPDDTELLIKTYLPDVVVIDGLVDYLLSFNDETQSHNLLTHLIRICDIYHCTIFAVLHTNKGDDDNNMRGHLGTMLAQKASTVLLCSMKDGVITIKCTESRHRAIPEWHLMYDDYGHIVSADSPDGEVVNPAQLKEQKRDEAIIEIIHDHGGSVSRKDLSEALIGKLHLKRTTVANIISKRLKSILSEEDGMIKVAANPIHEMLWTDF
ncbi:MAG: AAA family ATPase [Prevotella sp.]|nr:AAA family ATPase [Prevotella sp.]